MPRYRYRAKSKGGRVYCEAGKADSDRALFIILKSRELYYYEYSSLERTPSARPAKLNQRQLPLLYRRLATTLTVGMSLSRVPEVGVGSARGKTLKATFVGLKESIHKERTLSEAMERVKGVFPSPLAYIMRTGRSSGGLGGLLHKVAGCYGREGELNGRVQATVTYPVILFSVTVSTVVFMLTTVLP